MAGAQGTIWLDIHFRWWARPRLFRWLWRRMGYVPSWALRIRRIAGPEEA